MEAMRRRRRKKGGNHWVWGILSQLVSNTASGKKSGVCLGTKSQKEKCISTSRTFQHSIAIKPTREGKIATRFAGTYGEDDRKETATAPSMDIE